LKVGRQQVMHCPCGNAKVLALGLCATCYTLKRQDEEHFGGLREAVLERDGYRCRVCDASGRDKRSIIVHHRVPGKSVLNLMLSLCPACHAKIHRTKAVLSAMPPLLLKLWREQHPKGHEQTALNFALRKPSDVPVAVFDQKRSEELAEEMKRILERGIHGE
jgi:hypothetical protein